MGTTTSSAHHQAPIQQEEEGSANADAASLTPLASFRQEDVALSQQLDDDDAAQDSHSSSIPQEQQEEETILLTDDAGQTPFADLPAWKYKYASPVGNRRNGQVAVTVAIFSTIAFVILILGSWCRSITISVDTVLYGSHAMQFGIFRHDQRHESDHSNSEYALFVSSCSPYNGNYNHLGAAFVASRVFGYYTVLVGALTAAVHFVLGIHCVAGDCEFRSGIPHQWTKWISTGVLVSLSISSLLTAVLVRSSELCTDFSSVAQDFWGGQATNPDLIRQQSCNVEVGYYFIYVACVMYLGMAVLTATLSRPCVPVPLAPREEQHSFWNTWWKRRNSAAVSVLGSQQQQQQQQEEALPIVSSDKND